MDEVKRVVLIERELLDMHHYFNSLIVTAFEKGVINESFVDRIQQELINLLALRCRKYTSGESSSVPVEAAEDIMQSVNFTLDLYLKKIPEPEDALYALKRFGVEQCYLNGLKEIKGLVGSTRLLYEQVKKSMIRTDNYAYNSTVIEGIQEFFKRYDIEFSAHEILITADYPVCIYPQEYKGIEFIREYLKNIECENRFCNAFPKQEVQRVLSFYAIDYNDNIRDMMLNIYEVVLANSIACVIAGEEVLSLRLSDEAKKAVRRALEGYDRNQEFKYNVTPYAAEVLDRIDADNEVRAYTLAVCNSMIRTILFSCEL